MTLARPLVAWYLGRCSNSGKDNDKRHLGGENICKGHCCVDNIILRALLHFSGSKTKEWYCNSLTHLSVRETLYIMAVLNTTANAATVVALRTPPVRLPAPKVTKYHKKFNFTLPCRSKSGF